jgi:hypothetical protein
MTNILTDNSSGTNANRIQMDTKSAIDLVLKNAQTFRQTRQSTEWASANPNAERIEFTVDTIQPATISYIPDAQTLENAIRQSRLNHYGPDADFGGKPAGENFDRLV